MKPSRFISFALVVTGVFAALTLITRLVQAAPNSGVVNAPCTDVELSAALSGGGLVTFSCGGPATITATAKTIAAHTTIDGSNNGQPLTLTAASGVRLFTISSGIGLTLTNLTVADLNYTPYPINNQGGTLVISNSTFTHNSTHLINGTNAASVIVVVNSNFISNTGSSITSNGPLTVTGSLFQSNYADGCGNSIYAANNRVTVRNSQFISNSTAAGGFPPVGGAICSLNSTLDVADSTFTANRGGWTGGIFLWSGSPILTVTNSTFSGNFGGYGAAIHAEAGGALLTISNTTFLSNTSSGSDGAIFLNSPGVVQVLSSTFQSNTGSGIYVNGSANPLIIADSQFISNTSAFSAGAIDAGTITVTHSSFISNTSSSGSGALDASRQAYITGSTFLNNTGYWGGAMELSSGGFGPFYDVVANSVIKGNASTSQGGGGIRATQYLTLIDSEVSNNTVVGNSYGGGLYFYNGYVLTATHTLFQNNVVTGTGGLGGGVYFSGISGVITGSTILSNSAGGGGGVYQSSGPLQIFSTLVQSNTTQTFFGGGLESHDALTLRDVNVIGNRNLGNGGQGFGGGLYVASFANPLNVSRSLFYNNIASNPNSMGGGIYLTNPAFITNTTIYSNSAGNGGNGLNYNTSYVITLTNNTIMSNTNAGGIITSQLNHTGPAYRVILVNTLLGGSNGGNCAGNKVLSLGHNLSSDASCALTGTLDLNNTNPVLNAFANNGGATYSFMPTTNSPAVNAGDSSQCPIDDQRGIGRPIGSACDIGSIESPYLTPQTITFSALPDRFVNNPPFIITATASSNLVVAFNSSGVCGVAASTVTLSGIAGTCTITATQPGDSNYAPAADVARTFTVTLVSQTINFATPANHLIGDPPFIITATASSGLSVTLASQTASVCSINVNLVTLLGGGLCTIRATQGGNSIYAPAPNVDKSFTVFLTQTITFAAIPDHVLGDAVPLTATASSGLAVWLESLTTSVCDVNGNTAALFNSGFCIIVAHQDGDAAYWPAPDVARSFTVYLTQTISFAPLPDRIVSDPPFTLTATATSNLPIAFNASGVCAVNGITVTLSGIVGSCTITATQAGNAIYAPATAVARSFNVTTLFTQTITFAPIPDHFVNDPPFSIAPTASSGLSVTVTSNTPSICTISSYLVTLLKDGTCTLHATQGGNATYASAPDVDRTFTVKLHKVYLPLIVR